MKFNELKSLPIDQQVTELNSIMQKVTASGKPAKRSKTFAKDSGLGVCLSAVEKHMRAYNYVLSGNAFILQEESAMREVANKPDKNLTAVIIELHSHHESAAKKSLLIYPTTTAALDQICERYSYLSKTDIVNALLLIGIGAVTN